MSKKKRNKKSNYIEQNISSPLASKEANTSSILAKPPIDLEIKPKSEEVSVVKPEIENEEVKEESVTTIVSKDMEDITDATCEAMDEVKTVIYNKEAISQESDVKSIRNLDISEKVEDTTSSEISSHSPVDTKASSYTMVKETKSHRKAWIILLVTFFLLLLLLLLSTIFALCHIQTNTITSGISINGIDVSNLTKEEAIKKVSSAIQEKLEKPITLKHGEYETTVFAQQFDVTFDAVKAVDLAYKIGRDGNIFENNFTILAALFSKTDIGPNFSYSDETLDSLIKEIETNLPDRMVEPSYYVDGNQLVITKGINGVEINSSELKAQIIYCLNNLDCATFITIPVVSKTAKTIDINTIHSEIYKAAQDAYYTTNPYVVHPHVNGVDFAISVEEAIAMLAEDKESYTIALKVLSPKVTTNQIGTEAFPDLLASFSTTYSTSNANRSTNIRLASSKINGTVIMPGETFSYNQVVGKRTAAAGFKSAAVYSNGEVTTGIGGGICQVSSTLYNAVLYANLDIVERTNHGFNPGYVKAGRDATVSWGGPDFKFKNNRNYPIKIVCSGSGGKIYFQIFGLKTNDDYEVEIQSSVIQSIAFKTVYQNDSSLAKGKTKVIQNGSNGCKTQTYKILKKNGAVVSKTLLSKDTYNPHNKIVAVGTK